MLQMPWGMPRAAPMPSMFVHNEALHLFRLRAVLWCCVESPPCSTHPFGFAALRAIKRAQLHSCLAFPRRTDGSLPNACLHTFSGGCGPPNHTVPPYPWLLELTRIGFRMQLPALPPQSCCDPSMATWEQGEEAGEC